MLKGSVAWLEWTLSSDGATRLPADKRDLLRPDTGSPLDRELSIWVPLLCTITVECGRGAGVSFSNPPLTRSVVEPALELAL